MRVQSRLHDGLVSYDGGMRPAVLYLIGVLLFLAGAAVGIACDDEGWWRAARIVLVGGGAGLIASTFVTSRRNKKSGEQPK